MLYIPPMPMPNPFTVLEASFAAIIRALCMSLGARNTRPDPLPHPMFVAVFYALSGRIRRFAALVARVRAGVDRKPAATPRPARTPVTPVGGPVSERPVPERPVLPRRRGWLLPLIPNAPFYASQLRVLLAQPDMAELIALAPTLGRILRPMARMLAVELPPSLQRPPGPRRRRARPEKPKPTPPDRALPSRRPSIVVRGTRLPRLVFGPG